MTLTAWTLEEASFSPVRSGESIESKLRAGIFVIA